MGPNSRYASWFWWSPKARWRLGHEVENEGGHDTLTMDPFSSGAFGIPELKTQFVRNKSSINGPFLLRSHVKSPGVQTRPGRWFSFAFNSFLWVQRKVSEGEPPFLARPPCDSAFLQISAWSFPVGTGSCGVWGWILDRIPSGLGGQTRRNGPNDGWHVRC